MRAIGYTRVSTDKQAEHGVSLEAQSEKIRAMALVHEAVLIDLIVDAESAKSLKRPGLERVLDLIDTRQVDAVIVAVIGMGADREGEVSRQGVPSVGCRVFTSTDDVQARCHA